MKTGLGHSRIDGLFVVGIVLCGLLGFGGGYLVRSAQVHAVKPVAIDYRKPWWSGARGMPVCTRAELPPTCVVATVKSDGSEVTEVDFPATSSAPVDTEYVDFSRCGAMDLTPVWHYWYCDFSDFKGTSWEVMQTL